jgi:hypothetical protein
MNTIDDGGRIPLRGMRPSSYVVTVLVVRPEIGALFLLAGLRDG